MMLNELDFFSYAVKINWKRENLFFSLENTIFSRQSPRKRDIYASFMPLL